MLRCHGDVGPLLHSHAAAYPSLLRSHRERGVFSNPRIGVGDYMRILLCTRTDTQQVCVMLAVCGLNQPAFHSSCLSLSVAHSPLSADTPLLFLLPIFHQVISPPLPPPFSLFFMSVIFSLRLIMEGSRWSFGWVSFYFCVFLCVCVECVGLCLHVPVFMNVCYGHQ